MEKQPLLDKLSEFLMVEQGGLQLYRVAASRAITADLKAKYEEFGEETARHRKILVELIDRLGGDPNYISPTARLAQVKSAGLIGASCKAAALSPEELEANDLENVLLAETKDHADWHFLELLTTQLEDPEIKEAVQAAVDQVAHEEDEHLDWARQTLAALEMKMLMVDPPPSPLRWQSVIANPDSDIPVEDWHPAPVFEGLLEHASLHPWTDTPITRGVMAGEGFMPPGR